ncbi:serine hydrolase domain-containing protein [Saccharicrinis sp. FJH62]|uniref:serine hydrolase domain-containing protein n=1 Tax=Saccharicrinis sp. FJH62 TaxID=3344657 RepID=UPI0035D526BA
MKNAITILFSIILTVSGFAQTKSILSTPPLSEATAASAGMSEERLERIDDMLMECMNLNQIPGAVALVARNGKIVYYKSFGMADVQSKQPFKRDDIFRIASQTKAITSTAVMMLWEEGKFRLDDPISKYIPEFKDARVLVSFNDSDSSYTTRPANKPITIRHLLTHTSGIGYGFIDNDQFRKIYQKAGIIDAFSNRAVTIEDNIKKLAKLPLHHDPGEKFTYSEGLDVLAYFIEIISGMPLDQFFKERIFEPLGMKDTYFYLPDSKKRRMVPVQTKKDDKWVRFTDTTYYNPDYPTTGARMFFSGGAGLSSTVKDYANFLQMYLNKGEFNGKRLLSRTTVQVIMANQVGDLLGNSGAYYGLAFGVLNQDGQNMGGRGSAGTFDWGGYFNTQYFADPKENVIGILFKQTQNSGPDDTGWKFRQLVGQAIDD